MTIRALFLLLAWTTVPLAARPPKPPATRMHPSAPPTIPHPVDPGAACGDCHGPERSGGVPGIPHRAAGYCQSCHVTQQPLKAYRSNAFKGERSTRARGVRAYPGAPPQLPHPIFMRENCLACHGKEPRPGTGANPHPGRPHCLSCHTAPPSS